MSEELQTDDNLEEISDTATDTVEELEENTSDVESESKVESEGEEEGESPANKSDPESFSKRINKKHYEVMEARRQLAERDKRIQELESKIVPKSRPNVPEAPDPYDDNYYQLMKERDEAAAQAMRYDLDQQREQERNRLETQRKQQEKSESLNKDIQAYADLATKFNISDKALKVAGDTVGSYGLPDSTVMHILTDDHGPLITKYLAENIDVLDKVSEMSDMKAAIYIENVVKPKAANGKLKPAPNKPATTLGGGGSAPHRRGPKGATFE